MLTDYQQRALAWLKEQFGNRWFTKGDVYSCLGHATALHRPSFTLRTLVERGAIEREIVKSGTYMRHWRYRIREEE